MPRSLPSGPLWWANRLESWGILSWPPEEWPNGDRPRTDRPSASSRPHETLDTHQKEQTEMNRALLLADRLLLKGAVFFSVALTAMTLH